MTERAIFRRLAVLASAAMLLLAGCGQSQDQGRDDPRTDVRPDYMGFSPWPYDDTLEAQTWTYDAICANGDIVSHHIEEGVPWQEALDGTAFPAAFTSEILTRTSKTPASKAVLLQISPLSLNRDGMALNRGANPNEALPSGWAGLKLSDAKVEAAFLNYAERMIGCFHPRYLVLGVEANLLIRNAPSLWPDYLALHSYIYKELKKAHPEIELQVSLFCVPFFPEWSASDDLAAQKKGLADLEPYCDSIAFSVHPFMSGLLADSFPDDYVSRLFALTAKPVAVSESSYPAQSWHTSANPTLEFKGTPEKQDRFLSLLLGEAQRRGAEYLVWYAVRDYDALWAHALGSSDDALIWRDTGLYDENGNPRPALATWEAALAYEREP